MWDVLILGRREAPSQRMATSEFEGRMMDKTQPHPLFKLATELGPLLVFFVANAKFHLRSEEHTSELSHRR